MTSLRNILIAVVTQLQTRGGVLHEDAQYWLAALKAGQASAEDPQSRIEDLEAKLAAAEARLAEAEEKIEFLGEFTGAVAAGQAANEPSSQDSLTAPADDDDYLDEDPRGY